MQESLDELVRRVDEDRWLASRFAPGATRPALAAIYALNYEIARTAEAVTNETLGDIRLAWWREAIQEIHAGAPPRAHPALEAYAASGPAADMLPVWEALIAARESDLTPAPFEGWTDLQAYVEATAGGVIKLAIAACLGREAARPRQLSQFAAKAGQVWGYAGLVRAAPYWAARGRTFLPAKLMAHLGLTSEMTPSQHSTHALRSAMMAVLDRGRHSLGEARDLAGMLPAIAFPGYGYLTLAKRYLRDLTAPEADLAQVRPLALLVRQLALVKASALGKF
ncbi:MAG: squalene/phytoene synthase family protein [Hyphomonadaceae bacterium]